MSILSYADINYIVKGKTKLSVGENETVISNILRGTSPLKVGDSIEFIDQNDIVTNSIFIGGINTTEVPDVFNNTLIFSSNIQNIYNMEMCFWDHDKNRMIMCMNEGRNGSATTIRRSVQIIGNTTIKEDDLNFTVCENAKYIDCNTDQTGADLLVDDDIEADSIYAKENIVIDGNINVGGIMTGTLSLEFTDINISNGNITYLTYYMGVLGEGGINDQLVNINGGSVGDIINIVPTSSSSDITLIHGTGNLDLNGANCALKSVGTKAELRRTNGDWKLIVCLN